MQAFPPPVLFPVIPSRPVVAGGRVGWGESGNKTKGGRDQCAIIIGKGGRGQRHPARVLGGWVGGWARAVVSYDTHTSGKSHSFAAGANKRLFESSKREEEKQRRRSFFVWLAGIVYSLLVASFPLYNPTPTPRSIDRSSIDGDRIVNPYPKAPPHAIHAHPIHNTTQISSSQASTPLLGGPAGGHHLRSLTHRSITQ